jgi:hypothetical protein
MAATRRARGEEWARTCSMGLKIDYLDDHRTDPAEGDGVEYGQRKA